LKKSVLFLCAVAFLALTGAVSAEISIGVVDANKIVEKSPQYAAVRKSLESEFKRRNQDLVAKQKQLKKLEEKLSRDGAIMSAAEVKRLEKDIRARRRKLKSTSDEYREDLNLRRNEEFNKLLRQVSEVVHQLAKDDKVDLILSEGVVYASDKVNLTDKVLKRLKSQYKGRK